MTTKKILVISLFLFVVTNLFFILFQQSNWRFVYEQQSILRCLPIEFNLTHLTKIDHDDVKRGMLVAVKTDRFKKFYKGGVNILKLVVGVPGDAVEIKNKKAYINGVVVANYPPSSSFKPFAEGKFRLKQDEYWLSGTTPVSLDSRYVGPFSIKDFIGKSYAIL